MTLIFRIDLKRPLRDGRELLQFATSRADIDVMVGMECLRVSQRPLNPQIT